MNFQFYCPQGHLLQADTAHAGSVIVCPICGTQFIIPSPPPQVAVVTPVVSPASPAVSESEPEDGLNFASRASGSPRRKGAQGPNLNQLFGGEDASRQDSETESSAPEASPFAMMDEKKAKERKAAEAAKVKSALASATKAPKKAEELELVHIPCPKGHVLDVDREMLGQRVQCPVCRAVYDLKLENSLEFIRQQKAAEELEEARLGKVWIVRAMIAVILLALFLIFIMFA